MSLLRNIKIKYLVLFVVVCIITFVYSYFILPVYGDEIWCYGFSYNISKGMIPYRDFSLLQTPLHFFVGSIFIKIFGNYLFSIHIFSALLIGFIMVMLVKMMGWKSLLLMPLFLLFIMPTYNYLCLFFLFLIIYLIDNEKDSDLILGFIIGVIFLTKQSVGVVMLIPLLFYSKKKIKSICCFLIPILLFGGYLIWNEALYEFIDYCFLGMIDFSNNNSVISIFTYFELFQIIYMIIVLIKKKLKDKVLGYILVFQIMSYPIFDMMHWFIAFIPFFYYIFRDFNYKQIKDNVRGFSKFCFILFVLLFCFFVDFSYLSNNIDLVKEDDNYFYFRNVNNISIVSLEEQNNIVNKYLEEYEVSFFMNNNTYMLKLYMNLDINKYDLLLAGNMGYNGEVKYIKEIEEMCKNNSCVFFVEDINFEDEYCQFSKEIYDYVIDNYELINSYDYFDVYSN